jgi:hypothetical protein
LKVVKIQSAARGKFARKEVAAKKKAKAAHEALPRLDSFTEEDQAKVSGLCWVTLRARRVALSLGDAKSCWVTLRARWVTLSARWVTLRACWVALRARRVALSLGDAKSCWVTLRARWVALRARWVTRRARKLESTRGTLPSKL